LTNEFLAGKRVCYVNPLRLYLLASILFFFAVNYGAKDLRFQPGKLGPKDRAELEADLKKGDLPPAAREQLEALLQESPSPRAPHLKARRNCLQRTSPRLHPLPKPISRGRNTGKSASDRL